MYVHLCKVTDIGSDHDPFLPEIQRVNSFRAGRRAAIEKGFAVGHYIANVRDIEFNIFEVLGLHRVLNDGSYGELDADTARTILDEVAQLAEGVIAESFVDADRNPPTFLPNEHTITVPGPLAKTVQAVKDAQWWRVGLAEEAGGTPAPAVLVWAIQEMLLAANPSAGFFHMLGPAMAHTLAEVGTAEQKHWARIAMDRGWSGTMVLTEPDAGSDVGAGRTKAIAQPDGTWHIEGVKRFISGGDVGDTAENIFHLVLARPEGAGPGTKGLSLFYVPKFLFDRKTLEVAERNGAFVTNLEHKMGLKSSPTCEITFGAHGVPAVGYLVGDVHNGIAQMFRVIENARMTVGVKSAGTLSTGYLNALSYARERIQGADIARMTDKTAPRVAIIEHPDIRRSLLTQKAYAEGLRAVYLYTAAHQDSAVAQMVSGAVPELAARVQDFLLPIVKGVGSERTYEMLSESLQTFGGSGYLQDYPIEQYVRDARIDALYEGTTAIQALDFFFRKIVKDQGAALAHLTGQITATIESSRAELPTEAARLSAALSDVQAIAAKLTDYLMGASQQPAQLHKIGLGSVRLLMAVGDLLIGWRLIAGAVVAQKALDGSINERDRAFYQGKIAVAKFFGGNMLPLLSALRDVIESLDDDIMALDHAAF